jgi:heme/copper-type cytochrome/quinol oxidase subunit 2
MLYTTLNSDYRKWNSNKDGTGGWPASRIRAVLNGAQKETADGSTEHNATSSIAGTDIADLTEEESVLSLFPEELQNAIVKKRVKSDAVYTNALEYNVVTYDKLWLFAYSELLMTEGFDADTGFGNMSGMRKNEALSTIAYENDYPRNRNQIYYLETNSASVYLKAFTDQSSNPASSITYETRSLYSKRAGTVAALGCLYGYTTRYSNVNSTAVAVAPGFCIGSIAQDSE